MHPPRPEIPFQHPPSHHQPTCRDCNTESTLILGHLYSSQCFWCTRWSFIVQKSQTQWAPCGAGPMPLKKDLTETGEKLLRRDPISQDLLVVRLWPLYMSGKLEARPKV